MATKDFITSELGCAMISHGGGKSELHSALYAFIGDMDTTAGELFNLPTRISIENRPQDVEIAKRAYTNASPVRYKGIDKPAGWEVRQISAHKAIYRVPKYNGYVSINSTPKVLESKLFMPEDYRIISLGVLDLIQLATTHPMLHSTAITCDGKGILIAGTLGSGKTTLTLQLAATNPSVRLISEDRTIIAGGKAFCLSTWAWVRRGAGTYMDLQLDHDSYLNLPEHTPIRLNLSDAISTVLYASFNAHGVYKISDIMPLKFDPMHRDWFAQVSTSKLLGTLSDEKMKGLATLPKIAYGFEYSKDPLCTMNLLRTALNKGTMR